MWKICALWSGTCNGTAVIEISLEVLQRAKATITYGPAILPLDRYLKDFKAGSQRDTCKSMFTTALFAISKSWNDQKKIEHLASMCKALDLIPSTEEENKCKKKLMHAIDLCQTLVTFQRVSTQNMHYLEPREFSSGLL